MKIVREDLLTALTKVKIGIAGDNAVIEQMSHFTFTGTSIIAYNSQIYASTPFTTDFKASVKGNELFQVLVKMKDEKVTLACKKNQVTLKGKETDCGFATISEDKISQMVSGIEVQISKGKFKKLPEDFLAGAYLCSLSASRELTKGTLACVRVDGKIIMGGDNTRVSKYELKEEMGTFFIRASSVKEIYQLGVSKYLIEQNWVHFLLPEGGVVSVKKVEGRYPPFDSIFKEKWKGNAFSLPEAELKEAVDLASIIVDDKKIHMHIEDDEITIRSEEKGKGWVEKKFKTKPTGFNVAFRIHYHHLIQAIDDKVKMKITSGRIMLKGKNYQHLLVTEVL